MPYALFGTPRSHFTRVVRMVAHELGLSVPLVDVGDVGQLVPFAGNPLMTVPVLEHEGARIWDTHHVCRYLVEQAGRDPLGVESLDVEGRNTLAVIFGVMGAEVRLILAARAGVPAEGRPFDKVRATVKAGLGFLDARVDEDRRDLDYLAVATVAMWEHLLLFRNAVEADAPRIDRWVRALSAHAAVRETAPPPLS